jgi:hypothetical protein
MQCIFSGVLGVEAGEAAELPLGSGFTLAKTNEYLLSAQFPHYMTGQEIKEGAEVLHYLVYKHDDLNLQTAEYEETRDIFSSGLMALQVLKPIRTLGLAFYGQHYERVDDGCAVFRLEAIERRPPMEPGPWAWKKRFDQEMLKRLPSAIESIRRIMSGPNAELRNAFILLQLGLEHFHPLVAGLFWVMGLEAIFNSGGRKDFKERLCAHLGENTLAFPDWHSQRWNWTVGTIAFDLYVLRSKLAHGVDLRKAASDPKYPVDLLKKQTLPDSSEPIPYHGLLSEVACYLLIQVLQKEIEKEHAQHAKRSLP